MKNKWRNIAIIFIILFALETIYLIWAFSIGNKDIIRENECIANVCGVTVDNPLEEYDAYYYDTYTQMCECYKDSELIHQEFMRYFYKK